MHTKIINYHTNNKLQLVTHVDIVGGNRAKISACCLHIVKPYAWYMNNGYAVTNIGSKTLGMHRLISIRLGKLDPKSGLCVDHINHDKLDNTLSNIRVVSYSDNLKNRGSRAGRYKGVYANGDRFRIAIFSDGHSTHISNFKNEDNAAIAYNKYMLYLAGGKGVVVVNVPKSGRKHIDWSLESPTHKLINDPVYI